MWRMGPRLEGPQNGEKMYLLNWNAEKATLVASLGGNLTRAELIAFGEDLLIALEDHSGVSQVVFDHSMAKWSDGSACLALSEIKDACLDHNVGRVVSVVSDRAQKDELTTQRLTPILLGQELVVTDFPAAFDTSASRKAAA